MPPHWHQKVGVLLLSIYRILLDNFGTTAFVPCKLKNLRLVYFNGEHL